MELEQFEELLDYLEEYQFDRLKLAAQGERFMLGEEEDFYVVLEMKFEGRGIHCRLDFERDGQDVYLTGYRASLLDSSGNKEHRSHYFIHNETGLTGAQMAFDLLEGRACLMFEMDDEGWTSGIWLQLVPDPKVGDGYQEQRHPLFPYAQQLLQYPLEELKRIETHFPMVMRLASGRPVKGTYVANDGRRIAVEIVTDPVKKDLLVLNGEGRQMKKVTKKKGRRI